MKKACTLIICVLTLLVFLTGCLPKGKAEKHFENALEFINLQMLYEASIELNNGLRLLKDDTSFSKTPEKGLLTAFSLTLKDNNKAAIDELQKSIISHPKYWNSYIFLSFLYVKDKNYSQALELLSKVPSDLLTYGQIEFIKGIKFFGEKDFDQSIKYLKQAKIKFNEKSLEFANNSGAVNFIKNGSNSMADYLLGQAYLGKKDFNTAKIFFEEIQKTNSAFPEINLDIFMVDNHLLLIANPSNVEILNNLGRSYYKKKITAEAKKYFIQTVRINPSYSRGYLGLGNIESDKKNYKKSANYFEKVLGLANDRLAQQLAYTNLGRMYREKGQIYESIRLLEKGLQINPDNSSLKREYKISVLLNILNKKSSNADYYKDLGDSYYENAEFSLAIMAYQKYTKYKPNDPNGIYKLGKSYFKIGDFSNAEKQYKHALELSRGNYSVCFDLGILYQKNERFEEAIGAYLEALKYAVEDKKSEIINNLAYAYFENGETANAISMWKKLLKQKLDKQEKDKINKLLGVLK